MAKKSSKLKSKSADMPTTSGLRVYVLDTNVLLHDPTAMIRFKEHNVVLPMIVLEELDRHKKGTSDLARNARQVARDLAEILPSGSLETGFPLKDYSHDLASGRLFILDTSDLADGAKQDLEAGKADNLILACTMLLRKKGEDAILVTKDINLRVKALASGVPAQDYRNDRVLSDADILPQGVTYTDESFWARTSEPVYASQGGLIMTLNQVGADLPLNSFVVLDSDGSPKPWRVHQRDGASAVLYQVLAKAKPGQLVTPRNIEQVMALDLLRDPEIDCVSLAGPAGSGKTLLALAAALEGLQQKLYSGLIITRATVPMGEEIGFLPGTEADKMNAWLGGTLNDSFEALNISPENPLRAKVTVASMSFMRGRSFQGKVIILDEAQNLTIQQIRSLLTRVGSQSKIILTGNTGQIDSPFLDEGSSGLTWAIKNLQGWAHSGHLVMNKVERSRLAAFVESLSQSH